MILGIFARTFVRPALEGVLDAVAARGLRHVQFNLACAGLPTLPDALDEVAAGRIQTAFATRSLVMSALSATFNLIHPAVEQRSLGLRRLEVLARQAATLGTSLLTLCTGTRDPENMWRRHPDNDRPEAWEDLLRSLETALGIAARHRVVLGVEPEASNVIDSAVKARELLDHFRSPHLRIVLDPANLIRPGEPSRMRTTLETAFALLGGDVALVHAKDVAPAEKGMTEPQHEAAGTGILDYDCFLRGLQRIKYSGPLVLHSLGEDQVPGSVAFLRAKIAALRPA